MVLVGLRRQSDLVLDRLVGAAIALSILAVVLGIGALVLVGRSERKTWAALGIVIGLVVAALTVIPGALGGYQCRVLTP